MDIVRDLHSNQTKIKPYADIIDDGIVQLNFTLPVPYSLSAKYAAMQLATQMGINQPEVVHFQELTPGFTYFVIYGQCQHSVDYSKIENEGFEIKYMDKPDIESYIDEHIGRQVVVIGASTGTDTHSVGIDAMLNMKGFDGEYGLEAYRGFATHNLGSQVPNHVLVAKAMEVNADVILVSQTVTQQKLHVHNLTQLVDIVEAENIRKDILLVCGGPRISNELAKELGFDAGFSKGTYPNHLASYIVRELKLMLENQEAGRKTAQGVVPCALSV
jgi:beta-lysine 5,6-aminomutase beta subunit